MSFSISVSINGVSLFPTHPLNRLIWDLYHWPEHRREESMEKKRRILFVYDDELLGVTLVTTLELMGFEARAETNPRKALRDFAKEPEGFDAVVLDYSMPDLNGLELARWLSAIRPDLPMILLTGYPETVSGRRTEGSKYLHSPFKARYPARTPPGTRLPISCTS
jgi:CheY-like chemotaxis protein